MLFENLLCFLRNQKEHNINEIIQRALDLLGQIAARVLGTRVSDTINKFNSEKGLEVIFRRYILGLQQEQEIIFHLVLWGLQYNLKTLQAGMRAPERLGLAIVLETL